MSEKSKKDLLLPIVKFAVAFGLIALMIHQELLDFSVLAQLASPLNLSVALLLVFVNLSFATYRWTLILQARGFDVGLKDTFSLSLIGVFFNFAIPGSIGGDVVKAYYIAKDQASRRVEAVTSVLIDRIIGLYGMVILAIATMLVNMGLVLENGTLSGILVSCAGIWVGMTGFIGAAVSRTIRKKIKIDDWLPKLPLGDKLLSLYEAFHNYRDHLGTIFVSVVLSLFAQLAAVFFMIYVGSSMGGENLGWGTYFFSVPIGFIVSSLPVAPAGVGVGQYAFLVLFELYSGQKTNVGQTAITAFQVMLFAWGLIGGYLYLKKKQPAVLEGAVS